MSDLPLKIQGKGLVTYRKSRSLKIIESCISECRDLNRYYGKNSIIDLPLRYYPGKKGFIYIMSVVIKIVSSPESCLWPSRLRGCNYCTMVNSPSLKHVSLNSLLEIYEKNWQFDNEVLKITAKRPAQHGCPTTKRFGTSGTLAGAHLQTRPWQGPPFGTTRGPVRSRSLADIVRVYD